MSHIKKLNTKLNFHTDSYLNTYNPNAVDPIWKSFIKRAIGWQKSPANAEELVWQGIINNYRNNTKFHFSKKFQNISNYLSNLKLIKIFPLSSIIL